MDYTQRLIERLREAPKDAVGSTHWHPMAGKPYPYGMICHEAADLIAKLAVDYEMLKMVLPNER